VKRTLNTYSMECHDANQKWWQDIETGAAIERNVGELLALIHSEISEALEAYYLRSGRCVSVGPARCLRREDAIQRCARRPHA
jgi:hypothetical protein